MLVEVFITQFKVLLKGIETLDKAIKLAYKTQQDNIIFDSLPGAGPQLALRLLVAFGCNRDRYHDASELQEYAGIAPVIERSGKKMWTHWR
jgi:transposase